MVLRDESRITFAMVLEVVSRGVCHLWKTRGWLKRGIPNTPIIQRGRLLVGLLVQTIGTSLDALSNTQGGHTSIHRKASGVGRNQDKDGL